MTRVTVLAGISVFLSLLLAACGREGPAAGGAPPVNAAVPAGACAATQGEPFAEARVFIEFNSTDEDVGFHATFDSPGWREAMICGPDGVPLVTVTAGGATLRHGLSQVFLEGAEPGLDQQPMAEFLAKFPVGEYTVVGTTVEGKALRSQTAFNHRVPQGPRIVSPREGESLEVDSVVLDWEPVTLPEGVQISGYEVFVGSAQPEDGIAVTTPSLKLTLEVPASVTQIAVPPQLLAAGGQYEFEVLAIEAGGNKTISAGEFRIAQR